MKRAFTLIELLIVVSIVGLLLALVMPQLQAARSLARRAVCATQLRQIDTAFRARNSIVPYCLPNDWPSDPMRAEPSQQIYLCPEESLAFQTLDQIMGEYYIHNTSFSEEAPLADQFAAKGNQGLVRKISEDSTQVIWGIEGGVARDLWAAANPVQGDGTVDFWLSVSKTSPPVATNITQGWAGQSEVAAIYYRGQPVPGWADLRNLAKGASFIMDGNIMGGCTNYGYNSVLGKGPVGPNAIVLLDYCQRLANRNQGEDMAGELILSARHRGKINVLYGSGAVVSSGPTQLSPSVNLSAWVP